MSEREERIIIYTSHELKKTWEMTKIKMDTRTSTEALEKLIQLYNLSAELYDTKNIDELIDILKRKTQSLFTGIITARSK